MKRSSFQWYCKIVIVTSFIWCVIDITILLFFTNELGIRTNNADITHSLLVRKESKNKRQKHILDYTFYEKPWITYKNVKIKSKGFQPLINDDKIPGLLTQQKGNKHPSSAHFHRLLTILKQNYSLTNKYVSGDNNDTELNLMNLDSHHSERHKFIKTSDTTMPPRLIELARNSLKNWRQNGIGEQGKPAITPNNETKEMENMFEENQFNVYESNKIALNRSLPDVRPHGCKDYFHDDVANLPKTSVIIVFHNEAWSTLLRTVHSVITQSPLILLEEIILVDDASEPSKYWLGDQLDEYVATLPVRIHVERTEFRKGLIRARMQGAAASTGGVLTFLDSHCESTKGWLEPLLERINKERTKVVCPVIDTISDTTFEYIPVRGNVPIGGFSWYPDFTWIDTPQREMNRVNNDPTAILRSPTMAGGLFSIDRKYFFEIGSYDSGFKTWGAENLEMSFRVWQCGGTIEIVPCSHVGHVFRSKSPYSYDEDPGLTLVRNTRRVLEVWTDTFKNLFYALNPQLQITGYGDISNRVKLRDSLECKTFGWYLDKVYPEHTLPLEFRILGTVRNEMSELCVDVFGDGEKAKNNGKASLYQCHGVSLSQIFVYNTFNQIQHDDKCLAAHFDNNEVTYSTCPRSVEITTASWEYDPKSQRIMNTATRRCLDVTETHESEIRFVSTTECDKNRTSQRWIFTDSGADERLWESITYRKTSN